MEKKDTVQSGLDVTNPNCRQAALGEKSAFCLRANNQSWASDCVPRSSANPGGLTATQITAEGFIIPRETIGMDADGESYITGDVDMEKYAKWLQENYGFTIAY